MRSPLEKHALNNETENTDSRRPWILLVEDEYDLGSTLSMLLELQGLPTLHVNNGQQALDRLARDARDDSLPGLVLSDCMMPVMDGLALSHALRTNAATAHIPIVLMSAAPQFHDLSKASFDAFIEKPFLIEALLDILRPLMPAPP